MINLFVSSLIQVALFTLIPFLVFVVKRKTVTGFMDYIGLKKATKKGIIYGILLSLLVAVPFLLYGLFNEAFYKILTDTKSVTGKIRTIESDALAMGTILVTALVKTSLSEEILFRGFLAKRLIAVTGFQMGNILQSLIFGIIHTLLFLQITEDIMFLLLIFLFPAIAAYCKAYINEKLSNGSIIPSWITHGTGNLIAYSVVAFLF